MAREARMRAREAEDRELRRLLYVAMTRAEDRLYICGWRGKNQPPAGCWYNLVARGLEGKGETVAFDFTSEIGAEGWTGSGWRLVSPQQRPHRQAPAMAPAPAPRERPSWLTNRPPDEPSPPRPLVPSRIGEDPPVRAPLSDDGGARFQRGIIIHRLLEI